MLMPRYTNTYYEYLQMPRTMLCYYFNYFNFADSPRSPQPLLYEGCELLRNQRGWKVLEDH